MGLVHEISYLQCSANCKAAPFVEIRRRMVYYLSMETKPDSTPHGAGPLAGGVLFDIDGTLTRTNELIFATFNFIATKYCGRTYEPRKSSPSSAPPRKAPLCRSWGRTAGGGMDDLCEFYRGHHHAMASLHAGMDDVLAFLKTRGIPLGIFTGKGDGRR